MILMLNVGGRSQLKYDPRYTHKKRYLKKRRLLDNDKVSITKTIWQEFGEVHIYSNNNNSELST